MMHVLLKDDESSYSSSLNASVGASFFKVRYMPKETKESKEKNKVSKALSDKAELTQMSGELNHTYSKVHMSEPLLDASGNRTSQSKASSMFNPGKTPEFENFPQTDASQSDEIENPMTMTQVMMIHFEEYVT